MIWWFNIISWGPPSLIKSRIPRDSDPPKRGDPPRNDLKPVWLVNPSIEEITIRWQWNIYIMWNDHEVRLPIYVTTTIALGIYIIFTMTMEYISFFVMENGIFSEVIVSVTHVGSRNETKLCNNHRISHYIFLFFIS